MFHFPSAVFICHERVSETQYDTRTLVINPLYFYISFTNCPRDPAVSRRLLMKNKTVSNYKESGDLSPNSSPCTPIPAPRPLVYWLERYYLKATKLILQMLTSLVNRDSLQATICKRYRQFTFLSASGIFGPMS